MGSINHHSSCCLQQLQQQNPGRQSWANVGTHTSPSHKGTHRRTPGMATLSTVIFLYPRWKREATRQQKNKGTCPRPYSKSVAKPRLSSGSPGSPAQAPSLNRTILTQLLTFGSFPQASQLLLIGDSAALRQMLAFYQNSSPNISLGDRDTLSTVITAS